MRKVFFAVLVGTMLSSSAFADQCEALFEAGTAFYNQGTTHFNSGKELLEKAIAEYEAGQQQQGCKTLQASYGEISNSHKTFSACQTTFTEASTVCAGDNATTAEQNRNVCAEGVGTMEQVANYIQNLYSQYCQ